MKYATQRALLSILDVPRPYLQGWLKIAGAPEPVRLKRQAYADSQYGYPLDSMCAFCALFCGGWTVEKDRALRSLAIEAEPCA